MNLTYLLIYSYFVNSIDCHICNILILRFVLLRHHIHILFWSHSLCECHLVLRIVLLWKYRSNIHWKQEQEYAILAGSAQPESCILIYVICMCHLGLNIEGLFKINKANENVTVNVLCSLKYNLYNKKDLSGSHAIHWGFLPVFLNYVHDGY